MDQELLDIAHRLQTKLTNISPDVDRASLIWAHRFLTNTLQILTARIPELLAQQKPTEIETISTLQQESQRILDEIERRTAGRVEQGQNRPSVQELIRRIRDKLDDASPAEATGVPAKIKPGPKGLSGGVALPLPGIDYKI